MSTARVLDDGWSIMESETDQKSPSLNGRLSTSRYLSYANGDKHDGWINISGKSAQERNMSWRRTKVSNIYTIAN